MLTRRAFLKTTIAATAAVGSATSVALQSNRHNIDQIPLLIFTDNSDPKVKLFSGSLATSLVSEISCIDKDVATQIGEVTDFCHRNPEGLLYGLTRDSDFFVLEHTAAQQGFSLHYKGVHDFRAELMRHQVDAPRGIAGPLINAFKQAEDKWPEVLGGAAQLIAASGGNIIAEETLVALDYSTGDPGYLVSWMMKKA
jgi:hypothetical protein